MTTPKLFDVVMLTVGLPKHDLALGAVGTIVELHAGGAFEVEFTNEEGETTALVALAPDKFDVIWNGGELESAQTVQHLIAIINTLKPEQAKEVLDFARFLQSREIISA